MKTTRRDFIKISAIGAGGLALATPAMDFLTGQEALPTDDTMAERFPTYCEICFWKCAAWAYVNQDGKLWKVIGNDTDLQSEGRLCPRGSGGVGMYYDSDRLKKPLIRKGEPGSQTYEEVEWPEALDYIAEKLSGIKKKYGAEAVAMFTHGSGTGLKELMHGFGSTTVTKPSYAQCRGPVEAAWAATFGTSLGSPEPIDMENADCLVLIGSHIGENMHKGPVQEVSRLIDRGGTLITVDPRFSTVASKSKYWLPIKPATDIALLLAWIHVLIYEDLYDKDFVAQNTFGFEQLKAHVADKTPEWAFGITKLEPEAIRETARAMAKAAPSAVIHPGRHATWYGDDTQRIRAIAIINTLLGAWGRKGGIYFGEGKSVPPFPHPHFPEPKWTAADCFPGRYPLAGEVVANMVRDASIPSEKPEHLFKAWIVNGTNLTQTIPEKAKTIQALEALEFVVVIDTMPMEITGYADVVLPECTYLERYDEIRVAKHRIPQIAVRTPAAEPLFDSKPDWWIARELGLRLGLKEYFNWENYEEVVAWQLKEMGTSLEEMKKIGVKSWERSYDDQYTAPGEVLEFNTASGKIELYSNSFVDNGFDALPNYTAHPEPEDGYLRLNYGRAPMHTFSRTINNPILNSIMSENVLWVNPRTASAQGLKNGQEVWLENQDGLASLYPIKLRVTERIRWDSVYMAHGFGHNNPKLTLAHGHGASDSDLISKAMIDPIMGGTGMRGNFVRILTEKPTEEAKA